MTVAPVRTPSGKNVVTYYNNEATTPRPLPTGLRLRD